ncbi:MAG: hypothetical protein JSV66_05015 [Trueperaceae bacterium]|nr:MAG: hypothetical protein JSV66_05015 [Trueperaceae bacterium]
MNAVGVSILQIGFLAASGLLLLFALYRFHRLASNQKSGAPIPKVATTKRQGSSRASTGGARAEIQVVKAVVSVLLENQVDLEIHIRNIGKAPAQNIRLLFHGAGYRHEIEKGLAPGESYHEAWFTVPMSTHKHRVPEQFSIVWNDGYEDNRKVTSPIDNPFLVKTMWA